MPEKAVKDIKRGDKFLHGGRLVWTALEDSVLIEAREPTDYGPWWVQVKVQHEPDGGIDFRVWDDPNLQLEVR